MARSKPWLMLVALMVGVPAIRPQQIPPEISNDLFRDVLKVDPVHYKKDLENERVRVLHARLGPGESVPLHDDRSSMIIAITEVHIRFSKPGARVLDIHMLPGETRWGYADTHSIRNLYTHAAEYVIVELKK